MPSVFFSPRASQDLDEIKQYIETELNSPIAARNKVLEILDAIDNLAIFPEIGPSQKGKVDTLMRYRAISVAGYIVFYRTESDRVLVVRIISSQMDYLEILEF